MVFNIFGFSVPGWCRMPLGPLVPWWTPWGSLGVPWWPPWGRLGVACGWPGVAWGRLGVALEVTLGSPGVAWGSPRDRLWSPGCRLGSPWGFLGSPWGFPGVSLGVDGGSLGVAGGPGGLGPWGSLGDPWGLLWVGASWGLLAAHRAGAAPGTGNGIQGTGCRVHGSNRYRCMYRYR